MGDERGFEDESVGLVFSPLAEARGVIGVDPQSAEAMVTEALVAVRGLCT